MADTRTVQDAADEFLEYLSSMRSLSPNTVIGYRNDLRQFAAMDGIGAQTDVSAIKTEALRRCIGMLSRQKRAAASVNRFIAALRSFFAYCKKCGYLAVNPALELKTVKNPKRLPRFMTGAEVDKLCAAPTQNELLWEARDRALFEMFYSSGCRLSEMALLTRADLSADYSSAVVTGKGNKDRRVYFEADARAALAAYLADRRARFGEKDTDAALFVNQRGKKLSTRGISYIISRYSGIEGTNRHVSPHAFRHTFATAMLTGGADVRLVQELLGHANISTTQRYTHVTTDRLIEMYNKAHPHGGTKGT